MLDHILKESLTEVWLDALIKRSQITSPEITVRLLNMGNGFSKTTKSKILKVVGNKGNWVMSINPDYAYQEKEVHTNIWNEGTTDKRKKFLKELKKGDGKKAIELIRTTWDTESVITKKAFLSIIHESPDTTDIPFLEELYNQEFKYKKKEKKTEKECRRIIAATLLQLNSTSLHSTTTKELSNYFQVKKKKGMLGLLSSDRISLEIPKAGDSGFWSGDKMLEAYGFEPKAYDIAEFDDISQLWLSEFLTAIPMSFWSTYFAKGYEELVNYFTTDKSFQIKSHRQSRPMFLKALVKNAIQHNDGALASELVEQLPINEVIPLLKHLSNEQYEQYVTKKEFSAYLEVLENGPFKPGEPWSLFFSNEVIKSVYKSTQSGYFAFGNVGKIAAKYAHPEVNEILNVYDLKVQNTNVYNSWRKGFYDPLTNALEIRKIIDSHKIK